MKIVNKNFPSNNSLFGEPKEHLYLHKMCINLLVDSNSIIFFDLYSDNDTNFTDMSGDPKIWELFLKTLSSNSNSDGIVPATGMYIEKNVTDISIINDIIEIRSFNKDEENITEISDYKEFFVDKVIQIY